MNERIQQMIYNLNEKVGVHWINEDKLKFAELIVKECIPFVSDVDSIKIKQMKEHFGVEE